MDLFSAKLKLEKDLSCFIENQWKEGADVGFADFLKNKKSDWIDRLEGLQKLKDLIQQKNAISCSNFVSLLHILKDPMAGQV